ncbi:MAG TPA: phosphotransferase [Patescibacteria group bacterium]|nr:phosphotransferase [Patescibacteria group bacterium]
MIMSQVLKKYQAIALFDTPTVRSIVQEIGVGKLLHWYPLLGGWRNVTLYIKTTQGEYVLRVYRFRPKTEQDILLELRIVKHLAAKGVPVAVHVSSEKGNGFLHKTVGGRAFDMAMFTYISGERIEQVNKEQLYALGKLLGKIHHALSDFRPEHIKRKWYFGREMLRLRRKIIRRLRKHPAVLQGKKETLQFKKQFESDLRKFRLLSKKFQGVLRPRRIIHGDFHSDNVRFQGNEISGVFDFDNSMHAPLILDLATLARNTLIFSLQRSVTVLSPQEQIETILDGYLSSHQINKKALPLLIPLIQFGLYVEMTWTIQSGYAKEKEGLHKYYFDTLRYGLDLLSPLTIPERFL